tara:strand:- start:251 stop:424 length:174 start_codon:yes stop_codon:yes gene_type:complete
MGLEFAGSKSFGSDRPRACYLKKDKNDNKQVYFNKTNTMQGTDGKGRYQVCLKITNT